MYPFDRIDNEILAALQNNARLSNKELAARVGVAQSTCLERVRRMTRAGVIRGSHCEVDAHALGIGLMAMIAVRLSRHSRQLVDTFRQHVLELSEVVACYHMAGANDYLIHVAVRDSDHLRDLALSAFTTRPEVAHMETALVFEHVGNRPLPNYAPVEEF